MTDEQQDLKRLIRGERQQTLPELRQVQRVQSDEFSLGQFAQGKGPDHVIVDITNKRPAAPKPE